MNKTTLVKSKADLYEQDFNLWLERQATLLRERRFDELDVDNLVEEVESIGRSDKREVKSRLIVLLKHLLKYQHQADKRTRSWTDTIRDQRRELQLIFEDSPSLLRHHAPSVLSASYARARREASSEAGLPLDTFPEGCPYNLEQILDEDFLPD